MTITVNEKDRPQESVQRQTALIESCRRIKIRAKRMVWVSFAFEGLHAYPAAAETAGLIGGLDVSYLADQHRHMFHFKVAIEIFHNDREIEFIQFKHFCERQFHSEHGVVELNNNSVEMLADSLYEKVAERFPRRDITIEVSEDLENGCKIEYTKE